MKKPGKTAKTKKAATRSTKPAAKTSKAKAPPALKSIKGALAPLVGERGKAQWQPVLTATESPRRYLREIKIGNRFRKDKGDIKGLARSIDERGALLQPIAITPDNTLVDGERRMLAWEQ